MNLDEQLRAALDLEAEMCAAPPPDLEGMIAGGQTRRRRRNAALFGGGVLAVVLAGGAVYAATQRGADGDANSQIANVPSKTTGAAVPPSWPQHEQEVPTEPGTYRQVVGVHESSGTIAVDLTFGTAGWDSGDIHVFELDGDYGGVAVYQAERLAGEDHCSLDNTPERWEETSTPAAETSSDLARQLAGLPSSTVIEPVRATSAYGRDAYHVRLRIDDDCAVPGVYHLAETSLGSHGISYSDAAKEVPDVIIDFLVVDLHGTPVVVESWHHPDAAPDLVAEVTSVHDSISFVEPV